jgi:hypothetical protein
LSSVGAGNELARPSQSANEYTFSAEHALDKIFEPGMLLGRSLQLLEDDFSIQNLQCIPPQDFALRESCRFDFNFGQNCEYIHIMIGHTIPSTMPQEEEKLKLSLVGALEAKCDKNHADRLKNAKRPDSIVARANGRSETDSLLLIFAPPSTLESCCEAQIFSILVRSMVYAPIISFGKGSERLQPQVNGCCLVLLQHILALDLLEKEQSALKAICPVALTGSATSFSCTLEESALESFLESLPSGFDEKIGKQTHKVAKILLGRIGISPKERTVCEIFKELFKGKTRSTDGGGVSADVIAEEILKALETQIVEVKSQKFKVSCPQGEEVIKWLESISWGSMSATFAEREVCSLLDIMKLPKNALFEICQEKVKEDQNSSQTKEGVYLNLRSSIDDLKNPKKKFHEEAKSLQDRLDGFRDETISWANALFAQHSLEVMVTKRVSLVFYFLLMVSTTVVFILEVYWRALPGTLSYHGLRSSILHLFFSTSLVCALIPVVIHLGSASWRNPKDVAKFMRSMLGICFCVFIFRQAAMITVRSFFDYFKPPGCATDTTKLSCDTSSTSAQVIVDCTALCAAVVLLTVLVVCPRYLTIILLLVAGLVLMVNGSKESVYWGTQSLWTHCAYEFDACACNSEVRYGDASSDTWTLPRNASGMVSCDTAVFGDPISGVFKTCQCRGIADQWLIFFFYPLGSFLLLGLMLLMYKRRGDAKRLRQVRQASMDDYKGAWAELLQGGNVTFVRAKLVSREDLSMSMEEKKTKIQETIQSFADAAHVSRAEASRAGPARNSWLAEILRRIRTKMGITEQISVSLRLKRDCSEVEVDKGLKSAMDVGRSQARLDMRSHTVPASLASLNVLCDKILDDLADQRSQDKAYARAHGQHQWWCKVPCLTRSSDGEAGAEELVVRYCTGGKRLQHIKFIDELFRDAQQLNNLFHTEIKSLLQQYGDACEFIPGPIKTPSRAIEKLVRRYLVATGSILPFLFILAFVDSRYASHDPFVCRYRREPERLTDLVRCRIFFKDIRYILAFVQDIQKRAWGQNRAASQAETYEPTGPDVSNVPRFFKICGLKNRLNPDDNAEETFGFRDLQFNLEVGFQNGKIVPCQESLPAVWGPGIKRHICEVQVLMKNFAEVLERHEYSMLRDLAGK